MLTGFIDKKQLEAKAVFGIFPAYSIDECVYTNKLKFKFPRQLMDKGNNGKKSALFMIVVYGYY